jgi:CubicO group peptidase (beta-lactamase class C family)
MESMNRESYWDRRLISMKEKIYKIIKESIDRGDTAGVNVLILKNGVECAYCEYGFRDVENAVPMSRDTIFRLYSQTKPVTAAAVMKLVSEGKVDLTCIRLMRRALGGMKVL